MKNRFVVREFPGSVWNVVDTLTNQFISPFFLSSESYACLICGSLNNEVKRAEQTGINLISIEESEHAHYSDFNYLDYLKSPLDPRD